MSAWFSDNPDKAWVEKLFLAYSPVWMVSMGVMVLTGWDKTFGDVALLLHAFGTALPLLVLPAVLARRFTQTRWFESYWFKANLYLKIDQDTKTKILKYIPESATSVLRIVVHDWKWNLYSLNFF